MKVRAAKWLRLGVAIFVCLFGALLFLSVIDPIVPFRVIFTLLFGWLTSLRRTVPQVTVNSSAIGFALLCSTLIVPLLHSFCAWLFAHVRTASPLQRWKLRWTLSLFAALWLLFGFVMGATGIIHQVGWMAGSDAPLLVDTSRSPRTRLLSVGMQITAAATMNDWKLADTRAELDELMAHSVERFHLLLFPDERGELAGFIVFPRAPAESARTGLLAVDRKTMADRQSIPKTSFFPMAELPAWIARLNAAAGPTKTATAN